MKEFWLKIVNFFSTAGWTVVAFLAALVIGIIVIRIAAVVLRRILSKSPISKTLSGFILTVFRFVLWVILLFILASIAHIPLTPIITAFGAVAIAVGLALQGSLANLANGVVILGTKPFKEGDYVEVAGVSGTVKAIRLLTCEIVTPDNKRITMPNSKITSENVINYSSKPTRRAEWKFTVAYDSDLKEVASTVKELISNHPKTLTLPEPSVRLLEHGSSALVFVARAWVASEFFWDLFFDINEQVFDAFKSKGIQIPYNQLDVHLKKEDKND